MAMTYKEYTDLGLGSFFDREQEKLAIARNIQDPVQRAAILADFEGKPTQAQVLPFSAGQTYEQAAQRFIQANGAPATQQTPSSLVSRPGPAPVPTIQAPTLQQPTYAPSQLASQESGAIGAASIASQMPKTKPSTFAQAARPKPYRVQGGDTLSSIAKKNNMSLSQLLKLNPKFKQQAKYKGGNTIFRNTAVNLTKPVVKKKPGAFSGMNTTSPGQFRMAEERSKQQATPTLKNPLGGM